jgi:hypothetical protein
MSKCTVTKHHKLLWWEWDTEHEDHHWVYSGKEFRQCKVCDRIEMYFGISGRGDYTYEDWRESV